MSNEAITSELNSTASVERELQQDLYRAIFRYSNEPIAIIDPEGFYLEQNAAHQALLGYTDEEFQHETPAVHMGEKRFGAPDGRGAAPARRSARPAARSCPAR